MAKQRRSPESLEKVLATLLDAAQHGKPDQRRFAADRLVDLIVTHDLSIVRKGASSCSKAEGDPGWIRICRDVSALRSATPNAAVLGPLEIWTLLREQAADQDQESFFVVALDTRYRARGVQEVTRGTLSSTPVHAREVFRAAILLGAKSVIVAHNHPAGTLRPSEADREVTRQLAEAGALLGIPVVDHLILTEDGYYSFAEKGEL